MVSCAKPSKFALIGGCLVTQAVLVRQGGFHMSTVRAVILFGLPLFIPLTMLVNGTETHASSKSPVLASVDGDDVIVVAEGATGDVKGYEPEADPDKITVAKLWIGLESSDAAGLNVDLLVNVSANGALMTSGHLDNVRTGSGEFSNAILHKISLSAGSILAGAELGIEVSARRACSGGEHGSGTVRLWYNGQPVDGSLKRDAGSRVQVIVDRVTDEYFLRESLVLSADPGSPRKFVDVFLNSEIPCPGRPFTSFGTWSLVLP